MASAAPATGGDKKDSTLQKKDSKAKLDKHAVRPFWDEDGYKDAVQRIEDGAQCLDVMARMIQERASLEKKHAVQLRKWASHWDEKLEKTPSFKEGTLHTAWRALLAEAESTASTMVELEKILHLEVREHLLKWKKQNYPKFLGRVKVAKKTNSEFEKALKPLSKAKAESDKKKGAYFRAAQEVHDLEQHMEQAKQYSTPTAQADMAKLKTKRDKAVADRDKHLRDYQAKHKAYLATIPEAQRKMKEVFASCQALEQKRIDFIKSTLEKYQKLVAQSQNQKMADADADLKEKITAIDAKTDLQKYAAKNKVEEVPAVDAPFEEWSPEKSLPAEVDDTGAVAAPGSLHGAWFMKAPEKKGRAHKRFFVLHPEKKEIHYFEKLSTGVPEKEKGVIDLKTITAIEAGAKDLVLVSAKRRWELSATSSKEEKLIGEWATYISETTGVKITEVDNSKSGGAAGAAAAGAVVGAAAGAGAAAASKAKDSGSKGSGKDSGKSPDKGVKKLDGPAPGESSDTDGLVVGAAVAGGAVAAGAVAGAAHATAAPDAPQDFEVEHATTSTLKLAWKPPHNYKGEASYHLFESGKADPIYSGPATSHTVTGLSPSTLYKFNVRVAGKSSGAALEYQTLHAEESGTDTPQYGDEHHEAATTIQAHFRGHKARKASKNEKQKKELESKEYGEEHHKAATKIQANFRGYKVRDGLEKSTEKK
eukprot:m.68125 g.68125  ORF g.68125 m.68125 type:complete len:706 (-) comp16677_c0_seq1:119-2236(-)